MEENHPITPPPELVEKWDKAWDYKAGQQVNYADYIATQAARWGSDQELEACCEWLHDGGFGWNPDLLRATRRPEPLSLKEQALETLQRLSKDGYPCNYQDDKDWETIRKALESIPDDN